MREQGEIEVELPAGKAFLRDESPRPLILMAGGTGFFLRQINSGVADR